MLPFLQNQWESILAGLITSLITFLLSMFFIQRKNNIKHLKQVKSANLEIIRKLKPLVTKNGLPEKEVIDTMIHSTARQYGVKSEELYSIRIICEESIREIIDNDYFSTEKKLKYTKHLKEYLYNLDIQKDKSLLVSDVKNELKSTEINDKKKFHHRIAIMGSIVLSVFAAIITIVIVFLLEPDRRGQMFEVIPLIGLSPIVLIFFICLIVLICIIFSVVFFDDLIKKIEQKMSEKRED